MHNPLESEVDQMHCTCSVQLDQGGDEVRLQPQIDPGRQETAYRQWRVSIVSSVLDRKTAELKKMR